MNDIEIRWEVLVSMLRKELAEYGGLFSILEGQRSALIERDLEGVQNASSHLEQQAKLIGDLRDKRLDLISEFGQSIGLNATREFTVRRLIRKAPPSMHVLLEGLVVEVERLIESSRSYLNRNQMLIRRAYEMNREFLTVINPDGNNVASYRRNGVLANERRHVVASNYLARA